MPTPFRTRLSRQFRPGARAAGCALALIVVAVALWAWRARGLVVPGAEGASWAALLPNLVVAAVLGLLVATVAAVVAAFLNRRAPWLGLAAWVAAAVLLATMGAAAAIRGWWLATVLILAGIPLVFAARAWKKIVGAVLLAALVALSVWPGSAGDSGRAQQTRFASASPAATPDPSARGPHETRVLHYGSGRGSTETAYANVDVTAPTTDLSGILGGWGDQLASAWGFPADQVPLNGTVWRPAERGSYPLVLIVHGNAPGTGSELGFGYLGETLASRGYVVAAIDENFLNTGVLTSAAGLDTARTELVRRHLAQWAAWSTSSGTGPLDGLADIGAVSLVGHSRGGEAVARAAAAGAPAGVVLRSVIALAPSDSTFAPDEPAVKLTGVDYLTVAGSYDADVMTFAGASQYARTTPGAGQVKAAVQLDRMNHTQFNSGWGRYDGALGLAQRFLATGPLTAPDDQRHAAQALVSGFLDLTVKGDTAQLPLFDGSGSLPFGDGLAARRQFAEGGAAGITPQGADLSATTLPGKAGERSIPALGLPAGGATVTLPLPSGRAGGTLRVDLAMGGADTGATVPVSLTARDDSGRTATYDLPDGLAGPLPGTFTTVPALMPTASTEPAFSTISLPLEALTDRGIDPARATVTLTVGAAPDGATVYLGPVRVAPAG